MMLMNVTREEIPGDYDIYLFQCVMHLEDRLQEIYFKSRMFAEYLHGDPKTKNMKELTSMLG